jgi:polyisoprenoid-binding protein YceI
MKKTTALFVTLLLSTFLFSQTTWKSDPMHSKLAFSIVHHGIADISGLFKTFEATATTNKTDFSDAVFELSAELSSIDTGVEMRDDHLRGIAFFEADKFPKMTFKSTSIKKILKDKYKLMGSLTLHGITKPVTINMWYRGSFENPETKAITAGFQFSGIIKRSDFNIGTEFPETMISDKVNIKADWEFTKQ